MVVARVTLDARQRQIENARLVGAGIEQITIESPEDETILNYVRAQPKARRRASKAQKRAR